MVSEAARSGNFFQFPIRMLGVGKAIDQVTAEEAADRIADILRYCIYDVGQKKRDNDREAFDEIVTRVYSQYYDPEYEDEPEWDEEKCWVGAEILGVTLGLPVRQDLFRQAHEKWSAGNSGKQQVRIRADIFWQTHAGDMSWREFCTLAAIYGALGDNQCLHLTISRIGAMALGYSGLEECKRDHCDSLLLTDRQTRRTVNCLCERGFFVRVSPDHRHVFYSHRLSQQELFDEIVAREVRRAQRKQVNQTEAMRAKVLEQLKALGAAPPPPKPKAGKQWSMHPDVAKHMRELELREGRPGQDAAR